MDKMGKNRDRRKLEELSCVWMKKGYAMGGKTKMPVFPALSGEIVQKWKV